MNDNLAEKVATHPHRWLIVAGVTFVIGLLTILPQVDELLEARVENADLRARIDSADQAIAVLPQLETRVATLDAQLDALQQKAVTQDQVSELRRWLVDAARQSGCNLKRVSFAEPQRRRWRRDDSPTEYPTTINPEEGTPFDLETRSVTLSVTGSPLEVQAIMKLLDADKRIKFTQVVDMKPLGRSGRLLQLDLTLQYFSLVEAKQLI